MNKDYDSVFRWQDVAAAVLGHRAIVLGVLVSAVVTSCLLTMLEPPDYKATARLMVSSDVANVPVSADERTTAVVDRSTEQRINDIIATLTSPLLLREVLEEEPPPVDDASTTAERTDMFSRALTWASDAARYPGRLYHRIHEVPATSELDNVLSEVLEHLEVERIEDSDLLEVSYTNTNPVWTAAFVNNLLTFYTSNLGETRESGDAVKFFKGQRDLLAQRRRAAESALIAFSQREGFSLTPEDERELRLARSRRQESRASMETELAGVEARVFVLEAERAKLGAARPLDSQVELSRPVEVLKTRIAELELERSELLSRYTPGSDVVGDLDVRIEKARMLLAAEKHSLAASLASSGPAVRNIDAELIRSRSRQAELRASLASLSAEISEYDDKIYRIEGLASEQQALESELRIAENVYQTYLKKEEQARFATAMHESNIMDVVIVERARVPTMPEPSHKLLSILAVVLLALIVGVGLAVLRERMDPTLNDSFQAYALTGFPVVAALPDEGSSHQEGDAGDGAVRIARRSTVALTAAGMVAAVGAFALVRPRSEAIAPIPASAAVWRTTPAPYATELVATSEKWVVPVAQEIPPLVVKRGVEINARRRRQRGPSRPAPAPAAADAPLPLVPEARTPRITATDVVPIETAEVAPMLVPDEVHTSAPGYRIVRVEQGTTLYSLMRKIYGDYSSELLVGFRAANPGVDDPARIAVGETLRFPILAAVDGGSGKGTTR